MSTDTKVTDLIINKGLTKAELNEKYQQGLIGDNELSIVDMEENVVQVDEMPVASASNVDSIVQFSGETTEYYTNGYFYKCTYSDGAYSWTQINVQPGGAGIEWKTIVDLPATYSAGARLACPQFVVQGGLPDGNYEFYYQVKTQSNYGGTLSAPFGVATYKVVARILSYLRQPYMVGSIAPVIDGNWMPSANYRITNRTVNGFYKDSGNFVIWSSDYPFITDLGDLSNTFVPGCFKLSAIKNTDTGDEYIATGIEPDGQQHSFSQQYSGSVNMDLIQSEPTIPSYFSTFNLNYGSCYGISGNRITIDNTTRADCSEFDISLVSSGGGKWHIIAENTPDSYKINLLEASGDLANVQIGYNESGTTILYINTPSGTTGTVEAFTGVKGSAYGGISLYRIDQLVNFTQFIVNTVGGDISTNNYGSILQYTGVTDANYTNGYFYKASGTPTIVPASMLCNETSGLGLTITCNDIEGFITALASYVGWDKTEVQSILKHQVTVWEYTQSSNRLNWSWYGDVDPNLISYFNIVGPEVPASTVIQWTTSNYVAEGIVIANPSWDRVDVQPAGATYTAGTGIDITNNVVSVDNTVLVNNPTGASSVNIKGSNNDKSNSVAVGSGSSVTNNQAVAVGWGSQAGYDCTAVGAGSIAYDDYSTAIGFGATVPYGVHYAIQLGNGTNNTSGTMAVALSTDGSTWTNYELLSSNGTIPEARLADTTNATAGQVLTLDSNLNAVWQAGGSGGGLPSQTGNAGKFLTTDGTDASWTDTFTSPLIISDSGWTRGIKFQNVNGYVCTGFGLPNSNNDFMGVDWNRTAFVCSISGGTIGTADGKWNNVYTTKINNGANITVPDVAGKMAVQVSLLPTAASTNEGEIYQFVGTTDSSYTNGHFYKCVSDGQDPATYSWEEVQLGGGGGSSYTAGTGINITNGSISVAAPTVVNAASNNVQLNICPAGGTQNTTDRSGESIVIGSNIKGGSLNDSGSIRIGNNINTSGHQYGAYGVYISSSGIDKTGGSLIINAGTETTTNNSGRTGGILIGGGYKPVIIGSQSGTSNGGAYSIAIGGSTDYNAQLNSDYSVLLNAGNDSAANITEHNTFWWGNHNGVYKLFDADGTIPAARHASLPVADGTYVLKLVIASGVPTLSWVAE